MGLYQRLRKSMWQRVLRGYYRLRGWHRYVPKSDHVFLVSFPKSGNTWVRFLLANVFANTDRPLAWEEMRKFVPALQSWREQPFICQARSIFNQLPCHVVKTHSYHDLAFKKVIYLVRDGRDALTSFYHYTTGRRKPPLSLKEIILGQETGCHWSRHVAGWLNGKCEIKLVVKYEDLLADTKTQLGRIIGFLGIEVPESVLDRAISFSSIETMRELERTLSFGDSLETSRRSPFVRKGRRGDWEDLFTDEDVELFWQTHGEGMEMLDYARVGR